MTQKQRPDLLAIGISLGIAIVGVVAQFVIAAISYGQLSERVGDLQRRLSASETAQVQTNATVSDQKAQIAAMAAKLDGIKSGVDTLNGKFSSSKSQ